MYLYCYNGNLEGGYGSVSLSIHGLINHALNNLYYYNILIDSKKKLTILQHPQSQVIEVGDPLTLTCRAVGDDLKYLWYFNGLSLQREDRNEYFINCFTDEDEGVYFCKVSNSWGELNSDMASCCNER